MSGHRRSLPSGLILAAGIAAIVVTPAFAATWTWDGGDPGGNQWTNTLNWNPDTAPVNNGTADIIFGGAVRLTPDMNASWNVNSVTFSNSEGAFTLNSLIGSTLTLGAGGITANGSAATASISSKLSLGNGTRTFTVADGAAPNDLDVTGVVSGGGIIKDGPGVLRLGALNIYNLGTTLNAGTILIGNDFALGLGQLTGNGGILRPDGGARTLANVLSGSFSVDCTFDVTLNNPANLSGNLTKTGSGKLIFAQAATFDGLIVNDGTARVDAGVTFTAGLTNSATLLLGTQTLTVNGTGIDNQDSLPLAGGTLAGSGPVVNNGVIARYGTIGGSGGFTNNAQLTVSGGNVTLANSGANANANAGNVSLPSGLQLRLTGDTLVNTGTVDLAGGIVAGPATLSNNTGGIVSGRGTISAPFANAGGTLRAVGGTMSVTNAFTNSGVIRLDDGAGIAGGAITNTGRIQGDGSISNAMTNNAGGELRAEPGKSLTLTASGITNSGQANLYGGLLEVTQGLTNNAGGFISGNGTLIVGNGLTNNGTMNFSGSANVVGDTTNSVGARSFPPAAARPRSSTMLPIKARFAPAPVPSPFSSAVSPAPERSPAPAPSISRATSTRVTARPTSSSPATWCSVRMHLCKSKSAASRQAANTTG